MLRCPCFESMPSKYQTHISGCLDAYGHRCQSHQSGSPWKTVSFDMLSRSILKSGRLEIHPEPHGPSEPSWALGAFMGPRPPLAGAPPIVACTTGMCCESCACALCALCALCAPPLRPCTRSRSKHCNRSQSTDRVGARMQLIQNFTSSG